MDTVPFPLVATSKFAVWSIAAERTPPPPRAAAATEQPEAPGIEDLLMMLGGAFAISMFDSDTEAASKRAAEEAAVCDSGGPGGGIGKGPSSSAAPLAQLDAASLLHAVVAGGAAAAGLADARYWESLAAPTASLYGSALAVGGPIPPRLRGPEAADSAARAALRAELEDAGCPPRALIFCSSRAVPTRHWQPLLFGVASSH